VISWAICPEASLLAVSLWRALVGNELQVCCIYIEAATHFLPRRFALFSAGDSTSYSVKSYAVSRKFSGSFIASIKS